MRVFTCDNFEGHYPVGVAAVMIANGPDAAKLMLIDHLASIGLPQSERVAAKIEIKELVLMPGVTIIADGNY